MTSAACSSFVSRMRRANTAGRSARKPAACQNRSMIRAPRRLLVAVNPAASFGRNRAVGPAVVERLMRRGPRRVDAPRGELRAAAARGRVGLRAGRHRRARRGRRRRHGLARREPRRADGGAARHRRRGHGQRPRARARAAATTTRPRRTDALVAALDARAAHDRRRRDPPRRAPHVVRVRRLDGLRRRRERAREPDDAGPAARAGTRSPWCASSPRSGRARTRSRSTGFAASSGRCSSRWRTTRRSAAACASCRTPTSPTACSTCSSCIRCRASACCRVFPKVFAGEHADHPGGRVRTGEPGAHRGRRHRRLRRRRAHRLAADRRRGGARRALRVRLTGRRMPRAAPILRQPRACVILFKLSIRPHRLAA